MPVLILSPTVGSPSFGSTLHLFVDYRLVAPFPLHTPSTTSSLRDAVCVNTGDKIFIVTWSEVPQGTSDDPFEFTGAEETVGCTERSRTLSQPMARFTFSCQDYVSVGVQGWSREATDGFCAISLTADCGPHSSVTVGLAPPEVLVKSSPLTSLPRPVDLCAAVQI